ncbi:MAG: hypothetical protein QY318_01605 [Candidatus Dojkabacteria bacterium]|nr:MAG: hypothetical protein QY318_01605 [Candidatus Dojkabacteria bacterium]
MREEDLASTEVSGRSDGNLFIKEIGSYADDTPEIAIISSENAL